MPAGFYQVPGLSYPRMPTDPNRNRDVLGNVIDPAMEPDLGDRTPMARDPAMTSLPPASARAVPAPSVTTLTPGRQTPFSRADAQALAALDPRALDEAKSLAALPESTPAKITGSFGGRNFEMQPAARVDRNALARLYAQAAERKAQERQDAVRGQEQAGRLAIVEAPGKQLTEREKARLESEERQGIAEREFKTPERDAKIAAAQAETEAAKAAAGRQATEFRERVTPEMEAADRMYERIVSNPIQTEQTRAAARNLFPQTTAGRGLSPGAAQSAATAETQGGGIATAVKQVMEDPSIAKLVETARSTRPGVLTGLQGRQRNAAIQRLIRRTVEDIASRNGADPNELMAIITSQING